ncbi:MAG: PAS domain S-box protein [Methanoregula sp.]|jgi:PAS domain S-box-containing protein|nr:PAS domain S-box protein [Methanoregula sp.]
MKILIADDNSKNLYMLEVLLKGVGHKVVTAKNGIEALGKLRANKFDGIISDILMPNMDGFRLIRECKKDPLLRQIPVIFYTATYTEKKDEEFGLSLGVIRYIIKPVEPEELLRQIHEAFLEHARSPRDFTMIPVPDEETFSREYNQRIGAKLDKKGWELKESEEKYCLLYENSMDAILLTSPDGSIQSANPAACALFQRTEDEIIKTGRNGVFDTTDPRFSTALEERARTGRVKEELTLLRKDGTRFPSEISSSIFTDRTGQKRSSMIIRDITERKEAEEELKHSFERFKTVMDGLDALVYVVDMETYNLLFINKYGKDVWGDIEGKVCWQTIQKDQSGPCPFCTNDRLVDSNGNPTGTYHWDFQNTVTHQWYDCRDSAIRWIDGRLVRLEIATDITGHKQIEEQLKHFNEELEKQVAGRTEALNKSLHEKEILFKEVHHRVKNNMQIIISLLNLQARTIDDPVVLKTIKDSQSRIRAMALVHERLYQSGDISSINLKDYIQFLAKGLLSFYGVKPQLIRVTINAPAIRVNIDTAIPLGLIVNELISNAIKYAFPEERRGEIVIDITKDKNDIFLVVRDNGVGIPADFDWRDAKSLGLRLVNSLVEQLQGTIELDRSAGTAFKIVVKEKK